MKEVTKYYNYYQKYKKRVCDIILTIQNKKLNNDYNQKYKQQTAVIEKLKEWLNKQQKPLINQDDRKRYYLTGIQAVLNKIEQIQKEVTE